MGEEKQPNAISPGITKNDQQLRNWIEWNNTNTTYSTKDVTMTTYDEVAGDTYELYKNMTPFKQKSWTLRNRVSYVRKLDDIYWWMLSATNMLNAIEYSYDIHGNVDSMLNIYTSTAMYNHGNNAVKLIAYKYDLISGKVNQLHYQPLSANPAYPRPNDEFYHRYEYDADNRLTAVYTTDNKAFVGQEGLEDREAKYEYYKHGPLARMVLGQQQVQGLDYAYTLQGWLKGVNSTSLHQDLDMGRDGKTSGANSFVARDAFGFNLNYFSGEYLPIKAGVTPFPGHSGHLTAGEYRPLYNGNISSMAVNIGKLNQHQLYNYQYDQLNRLVAMDNYRKPNETTVLSENKWDGVLQNAAYKERVAYDGNGNITRYLRHGNSTTTPVMDSLTYYYNQGSNGMLQNNRLRHIIDGVSNTAYSQDIDKQGVDNYQYDAIGNMTRDLQAGISQIHWTAYGKLEEIDKTNGSGWWFLYDANGNRVWKMGWVSSARSDFYVRDAQGNVLAVYREEGPTNQGYPLYLKEHHIYGSSRLGMVLRNQNADAAKTPAEGIALLGNAYTYTYERGRKNYELNNHLGNVLATITDKKIGVPLASNSSLIEYYTADVVGAQDYYPFGMLMPGRNFNAPGTGDYRYGFNGKEQDPETSGDGNQYDYGFRIYNPRIGRFLSVDPLYKSYPELTPYQFASNTPITAIDLDGLEATNYWAAIKAKVNGVETLKLNNIEDVTDVQFQQYRLIVKNPTASVGQLYNKVVSDIGSIYNTDYGKFEFEKQTQRNSLTAGDYIRIDPSQKGLADIFVKVVSANVAKDDKGNITSFDYQFRTLEGHVEVGAINFSAKTMTDANGNSFLHFMIESNSQIDPAVAQIISGFTDNIRNQQIDNWSQTMGNILKATGGEKQEASAYIETYENGIFNKDFKRVENNPNKIGEPVKDPKKVEQRNLPATPSGG